MSEERNRLTRIVSNLPDWELERLTAIEVMIDEALSILDRHAGTGLSTHGSLAGLSALFAAALLHADGAEKRLERLKRTRDTLDMLFPSEELAVCLTNKATRRQRRERAEGDM